MKVAGKIGRLRQERLPGDDDRSRRNKIQIEVPKMPAELIEFTLVLENQAAFPKPYPASKEIPEWYKSMPAEGEFEGFSFGTVKNCPPFLEAMTCGYIIPLVADISLSLDQAGMFHGEGPSFSEQCAGRVRSAKMISNHLSAQVKGSPFEKYIIVKVFNPWLIRTPPGYSTLFLPPVNRFQMHLVPLTGMVETDVFYREVHFPSLLAIPRGTTLKLTKGTPLVQAIPIKRDEFQSNMVSLDVEKYQNSRPATLPEDHDLYGDARNFYKNNYWIKKSYR